MKVPIRFQTLITAENEAILDGSVGEDDRKAIRDTVKAVAEAKVQRQISKAVAKSKSAGASSSGSAVKLPKLSAPRLAQLQGGADVDLGFVRQLLPKVAGCSMGKDTTWHFRFRVSYPWAVAPRHFGRVWNAEVTQWTAALTCLRWAWEAHTEATGESAPDFSVW